jgi:hypothetical protein
MDFLNDWLKYSGMGTMLFSFCEAAMTPLAIRQIDLGQSDFFKRYLAEPGHFRYYLRHQLPGETFY